MTMTRNSRTSRSLLPPVREGHRFESRFENRLSDQRFSMVSAIILGDCLGHCVAVAIVVSFHIGISLLSHSKNNLTYHVMWNGMVTICTTFLTLKTLHFAHPTYMSVSYDPLKKQCRFPFALLTHWGFVMEGSGLSVKRNCIYTFHLNEFQVWKGYLYADSQVCIKSADGEFKNQLISTDRGVRHGSGVSLLICDVNKTLQSWIIAITNGTKLICNRIINTTLFSSDLLV